MVLAKSTAIDLSPSEFEAIQDAREWLLAAVESEEVFSVTLANYFELQEDLLVGALHSRTYTLTRYEEFRDGVVLLHRRLASFLSSARAYLDQLDRLLCERFGKSSSERERFKAARSREYDGRLGFRFLEELRNHAQHRGRSVHSLTHSFWLDGDFETGVRKNALIPNIRTEQLRAEKFRKKDIVAELDARDDPSDLRPLIDDYMEGLGRVHVEVREMLKGQADRARQTYENALARYEALDEGVVGLAAVERDSRGVALTQVHVTRNWMELYHSLVSRTPHISHFVGLFITNEPKKSRA